MDGHKGGGERERERVREREREREGEKERNRTQRRVKKSLINKMRFKGIKKLTYEVIPWSR